jgi:uncharacterized protein GlcG (DUF336 family)
MLHRVAGGRYFRPIIAVLSVLCMAPSDCGGGGGGGLSFEDYFVPPPTGQNLTVADVNAAVNNARNAAINAGTPAIIAVVDRVGNVLALDVSMAGMLPTAPTNATTCTVAPCTTVSTGTAVGGIEGTVVPTQFAALSKAVTAAYLSSGGNAFSTRTANQIIQQDFPPFLNPAGMGGPLFGVQFSQLSCSDLVQSGGAGSTRGPHAAPLGLSADPGGLPLYKSGVLVGGIGVMTTKTYSVNPAQALPASSDEAVALAGQSGLAPPLAIQGPNISVGGVALDYLGNSSPASTVGAGGFAAGVVGQAYGTVGSGITPDAAATDPLYAAFPNANAYVLVDGTGRNRFDPFDAGNAAKSPDDGNAVTPAEAQALVGNVLTVAANTRAGIRIPINSAAQITVSIIDLDGNILAVGRSADAPIFGIDVSLQKARSAVFFSRADVGAAFNVIKSITVAPAIGGLTFPATPAGGYATYINATSVNSVYFNNGLVPNTALFSSGKALSDGAIGNISRPFFPDGQNGNPNGPLSLPPGQWSVFSTGIQTDLIHFDLANALVGGAAPAVGCGAGNGGNVFGAVAGNNGLPLAKSQPNNAVTETHTQLANGLQIFSGGFPLYRGNELVGAVGISGDGIFQDALIAYIGIQGDGAISVAGVPTLNNAPAGIRANTIEVQPTADASTRTGLVYIQCPQGPYITSREQNVCP